MEITTYIKMCMVKKGIPSITKLSEILGCTKQNMQQKLYKGNSMKFSEIEKIADVMNCEVKLEFIDKETKQHILP